VNVALAAQRSARIELLGCPLDALDMDGAVARCEELIATGEFTQHMAINAAKIVAMQDDDRLREIIGNCALVTADGQAIVWASRLLRRPLPERVAGIDLMMALMELCAEKGYRPYILGARDDVLAQAMQELQKKYPGLEFAGARNGYFSDEEEPDVVEGIRSASPDILFVAISSPRKEYFLGQHGRTLGVPFVMGVGGSIDVVAGKTRRAPVLWQRLGLEWLFRLGQEPRRLLKRYLTTNGRFVALVARALAGSYRQRAAR
jgi:N-acetylglucosaminyldiphosphoundecaprenol N-acetyl-beta-D-mannosaminyltransferase